MTPCPNLSTESLKKLEQVHLDLRRLVTAVAEVWPVLVVVGYRDEQSQNEAVEAGHSKLPYPLSKHNSIPARAVDLAPFPYDPKNRVKMFYFAGFVMATALNLGLKIRFGGDWNQNLDPNDDSFQDLFHFELM